mmetsp:Transcript_14803/g.31358  ORF Transcript_14803/g.31358 Transcript_14803/m.31358 type:complete len:476 (+) Transcript_14803:84-1511(+)
MSSTTRQMFEGVGAPVNVTPLDSGGPIDPTLDSCCSREIESNRKRNAVETALRSHDRVANAENQRRGGAQLSSALGMGGQSPHSYNAALNLLHGMSFGSGCRCCYDPNSDGGEYELLTEMRRRKRAEEKDDIDVFGASALVEDGGRYGNGPTITRQQQHDSDNNDDSDSDDEFDYLLDDDIPTTSSPDGFDFQAARRAELENLAHHAEVARYHGYGVHRQMHPQRIFASAGYGSNSADIHKQLKEDAVRPAGAVVHLYDANSYASASLDLCLEHLASRYAGTKFVRGIGITSMLFADDANTGSSAAAISGRNSSGQDAEWKRRGDLPMLLAVRDGNVVAYSSGLKDFYGGRTSEEVESRAVEHWLDRAGVLMASPPPLDALCKIRPEEEMLLENMRKLNGLGGSKNKRGGGGFGGMMRYMDGHKHEDIEEEEQYYDCGMKGCCKSFYHEHVGVKNEAQDGLLVSESQVVSSSESG